MFSDFGFKKIVSRFRRRKQRCKTKPKQTTRVEGKIHPSDQCQKLGFYGFIFENITPYFKSCGRSFTLSST